MKEEEYPNWIVMHEQGPISTGLEGCVDYDYAFIDYFSVFHLIYKLNVLDLVDMF